MSNLITSFIPIFIGPVNIFLPTISNDTEKVKFNYNAPNNAFFEIFLSHFSQSVVVYISELIRVGIKFNMYSRTPSISIKKISLHGIRIPHKR